MKRKETKKKKGKEEKEKENQYQRIPAYPVGRSSTILVNISKKLRYLNLFLLLFSKGIRPFFDALTYRKRYQASMAVLYIHGGGWPRLS